MSGSENSVKPDIKKQFQELIENLNEMQRKIEAALAAAGRTVELITEAEIANAKDPNKRIQTNATMIVVSNFNHAKTDENYFNALQEVHKRNKELLIRANVLGGEHFNYYNSQDKIQSFINSTQLYLKLVNTLDKYKPVQQTQESPEVIINNEQQQNTILTTNSATTTIAPAATTEANTSLTLPQITADHFKRGELLVRSYRQEKFDNRRKAQEDVLSLLHDPTLSDIEKKAVICAVYRSLTQEGIFGKTEITRWTKSRLQAKLEDTYGGAAGIKKFESEVQSAATKHATLQNLDTKIQEKVTIADNNVNALNYTKTIQRHYNAIKEKAAPEAKHATKPGVF